jgi:hypothetical protein
MTTYVIPCGGQKADTPSAARNLYTGAMFRHTLAAAQGLTEPGDRIMVLSARYGLVDLDEVLEPYEQRMDRPGSVATETITVQAMFKDVGRDVYALLPRAYFDALDAALRPLCIWVQDVYEATAGIGEQRRVNVNVRT